MTSAPSRLIYQVYVGTESRLYDFCTANVAAYCRHHGIDYVVQREPVLRIQPDPKTSGRSEGAARLGYLPIFEKENALAYLGEYDQVAVIDADVYVRPTAPNIFEDVDPEVDFAGVVERQMPITDSYRNKIRGYSSMQYDRLDDVDWNWNQDGAEFMNMGVMVMNYSLARFIDQSPAEFLARPEFKRFVDGVGGWKWSTDQTLLNWWLRACGAKVQHLDWRWNGLYKAVPIEEIITAHFVHFFLSVHLPDKGENVEQLLGEMAMVEARANAQ